MKRLIMSLLAGILLLSSLSASEVETLQSEIKLLKEMDTKSLLVSLDSKEFSTTSWDLNAKTPVKCPLESKSHGDIVKNISALYNQFNSKCREKNKIAFEDYMSQFKGAATKLSKSEENKGKAPNVTNAQQEKIIQSSVGLFNQLLNTKECGSDVKRKNVLETIAESLNYFAQVGLLVPNINGFYIASGSKIVSGLLLSINKLFERTYEWENPEERKFFLNLNCSFYNLRREIKLKGILDEQTPALVEQRGVFSEHISKISDAISRVEKARESIVSRANAQTAAVVSNIKEGQSKGRVAQLKEYKKSIVASRSSFTKIDGSVDSYSAKLIIYNSMDSLKSNADKLIMPFEDNVKLLKELSPGFRVPSFLVKRAFSTINSVTIWDDFINDLVMVNENPVERFNNEIAVPLTIVFNKIESEIDKMDKLGQEKINKVISSSSVTKYDAIIHEAVLAAHSKIAPLEELKTKLEKNIKSIDLIAAPAMFTSQDDGSANLTTIMETYDKISGLILGRQGSEYLEYITEEGTHRISEFDKVYGQFEERYLGMSDLTKKEARFACQDVGFLQRRWKGAQGYAEEAYDFVATNVDLFHDYNKTKLFKKDHSKNVQRHSNSVIFAKQIIKGEEVSEKDKKKYLYRDNSVTRGSSVFIDADRDERESNEDNSTSSEYGKYSGSLLLRINDNIERKQKAWSFYQTTKCNDVLAMD